MRLSNTVSALLLAGALTLPAISFAQTNPSADDQSVATDTARDNNDHGNWGWLGLFGLAGLMGLKRKDREIQRDHLTTRQSV